MGDYQPLRSDGDHRDGSSTHHRRIRQNVSSAKQDLYYKKPWTPLRKMAFVSSLLLCFMTISVFLWVIPCEWSSCPANTKQLAWDKTLYGVEMKGQMSAVQTRVGMYLIVMARGAIWNSSSIQGQQFPPRGNGLICLEGLTGEVSWYIILVGSNPTQLDCSILDIDNDGVTDCLVLGENGYLVAVNPESGIKKWKFGEEFADKSNLHIDELSFPVVIPDVNNDGVNDLIAVTHLHGSLNGETFDKKHYLILICGKTGHLLGKPINNRSCSNMNGLALDDDSTTLSYTCKTNLYAKLSSDKLSKVVKLATKKDLGVVKKTKLKQHVTTGLFNEFRVGRHRLSILRNTGPCPEKCSVNITVYNKVNQDEVVGYNLQDKYTYVMNPVVIHFGHSISGFVLKFWQWPHHPLSEEPSGDMNKTKLEKIRERVILLTFNDTGDIHLVNIFNTSQTDIMQICANDECQPELNFQTNSMMFVDLDNDGSQELISYSVSYKKTDQNQAPFDDNFSFTSLTNKWELQSKIRVICLQSELFKLFETITTNQQ